MDLRRYIQARNWLVVGRYLLSLVMILAGLLLLLTGYGFVALGDQLGGWLGRFSGRSLNRGLTTFLGTLLMLLLFNLPFIGEVLIAAAIMLVLGAMLITRFGACRYTPPMVEAGEDELSGYGRPTPAG